MTRDTARWSKALDVQLDLIRWWDSDASQGNAFALPSVVTKEMGDESIRLVDRPPTDPERIAHGQKLLDMAERLTRIQRHSIRHAVTYWVSAEMSRFLTHAQQDFPDLPLRWDEVSGPSGFILFEESLEFTGDLNGEPATRRFESLHWSSLGGYGDEGQEDFAILIELREPGDAEPEANSLMGGGFYTTDTVQKTLRAFWALTRQRIALPSRRRVDRPTRRRAERATFQLPEDGAISVVDLRRPDRKPVADAAEERMVEWSHRWIVSGHWRNQWYPSEEMHRPKFIEAYEKGPESAPLILKDRVYRVIR